MADLKWWQTAVFYQIYPRSFADGNADGIGDYTPLHKTAEDYFAFLRQSQDNGRTCLVVLNLSDNTHNLKFDLTSRDAR